MSGCSWDSLTPHAKGVHCFLPWSPLNMAVLSEIGFKMSLFFLSLFFLATPYGMQNFPDQGLNLHPLQWKHGVLTTGLPRSSFLVWDSPLASCTFPSTRDFGEEWTWVLACVCFPCHSSDSFLPLCGSGTHRCEGPGWVQLILKLRLGHQGCLDSGFLGFGSWSCYLIGRSGVPSFMPKRGQWASELAISHH